METVEIGVNVVPGSDFTLLEDGAVVLHMLLLGNIELSLLSRNGVLAGAAPSLASLRGRLLLLDFGGVDGTVATVHSVLAMIAIVVAVLVSVAVAGINTFVLPVGGSSAEVGIAILDNPAALELEPVGIDHSVHGTRAAGGRSVS